MPDVVPIELIAHQIYIIRGIKVIVDADLAALYQVETRALIQAVRRNTDRFPEDFVIQLTEDESQNLRSQIVISSWGGRRYLPYAFTEHGVAMLSAVLKSKRAVQMSVLIVRAFIKLRELIATHKDLAARIEKIEANQDHHASVINILAEEIDNLKIPPDSPRRQIGFAATDQEGNETQT